MNDQSQPAAQTAPDAIVLAAGLGTRMRPLTETKPKPLVELAGKPLIEHTMRGAYAEGVTRFAVNAHYLAEQVADFAGQRQVRMPGVSIAVSRETELLNTGGGVKKALPLTTSDPVLVMNSDSFWGDSDDRPLARLQARLAESGGDMVLLCAHPARALGFRRSHDFCLDPRGRVTYDSGAPVIFTGTALVKRAVIEAAPEGPFSMLQLYEAAMEAGRLAGVLLNTSWYHVGDPEALKEAEARLGRV